MPTVHAVHLAVLDLPDVDVAVRPGALGLAMDESFGVCSGNSTALPESLPSTLKPNSKSIGDVWRQSARQGRVHPVRRRGLRRSSKTTRGTAKETFPSRASCGVVDLPDVDVAVRPGAHWRVLWGPLGELHSFTGVIAIHVETQLEVDFSATSDGKKHGKGEYTHADGAVYVGVPRRQAARKRASCRVGSPQRRRRRQARCTWSGHGRVLRGLLGELHSFAGVVAIHVETQLEVDWRRLTAISTARESTPIPTARSTSEFQDDKRHGQGNFP